ncbi:HAD-IA family hydrolase [Prosthecomicrobium sp. N25]|uniref:HAD-IA family hydrolase n=1 Tax=Prosthecomicrobium sp. N25 TaxID=3129254 RepID=UPI0030771AC1
MLTLIFDLDGTVSDTEEVHRRAYNEAFEAEKLGWNWTPELYGRLLAVTGGKDRIRHYVERYDAAGGPRMLARIDRIYETKTARYQALVEAGEAKLRPGVARLVREAGAAGVRLALAASASLPNAVSILRSGFGPSGDDLFAEIVTGEQVRRKKPAPDVYALALERLGVDPDAAVAIEDSLNGLKAATAAGIRTVVTPSTYTRDEPFFGALAVLSDLGEPGRPYRHIAGAGGGEAMVTLAALDRWRKG